MDENLTAENEFLSRLREAIGYGLDVEKFRHDTIGKMVWRRSQAEVWSALQDLKTADPDDAKSIRDLQFRIQVAEAVPGWLEEVFQQGRNATQQFLQTEINDQEST